MPKCNFNKVAMQSNFIEIALRHGCSLVNLLHIFRTPFSKNTFGRIFLNIILSSADELWRSFTDNRKNNIQILGLAEQRNRCS